MRGVEHSDPLQLVRVLTVNTVAPIFLMGLAAREVPTAAHLRIVNVASGVATRAFPGTGEHSASRAALRLAGMVSWPPSSSRPSTLEARGPARRS